MRADPARQSPAFQGRLSYAVVRVGARPQCHWLSLQPCFHNRARADSRGLVQTGGSRCGSFIASVCECAGEAPARVHKRSCRAGAGTTVASCTPAQGSSQHRTHSPSRLKCLFRCTGLSRTY